MKEKLRAAWHLLRETIAEVKSDDVPSMSAAIAYYTVFSLPPLLVILVALAGVWFGPDAVQRAIAGQVGGLAGPEAAEAIRGMIDRAADFGDAPLAKLLGVGALVLGATGAFGELQKALNRAWEVEPAEGGGLWRLVVKRLLSFGMVLTIAFLLLVSLALSAVLAALGGAVEAYAPFGVPGAVWQLLHFAVSFAVIAALFAVLFKVLPDTDIAWRDVAVGSIVTAALFTVGKWAIGVYLGTSDPGGVFGAAGSLALLLIWIYYSTLILLAGAEFTQVYACRYGSRLCEPEEALAQPEVSG